MYRLIRDNIERIVNDTSEKEKLMYNGFKLLEDKKNVNIENLGIEELKNLAKENSIEGYSKLKKDELIEKLNNI
ncbi:Rho termination factor N-terminal domain-containing protein [Clostridioides difficile]|uniref:Rho termination factor N-terminal domain-containing protein n=1 Tax=Clostridioides difficile TaxID=1496 RepID=UPI000BB173FB|nr:Rho termination factor N-terminal domain-containing protein [Clostridioides difficile]EGT5271464.1 transcription termination factor Rho [Clostridioides difficile]EGT5470879.1 transcription termination factor Rho [Clostridioides difficile]MBH8089402.1 Rho termination factor N-terminal domain-containing protein [Clostridioides difficile]MBY1610019.1 Rho termination factor N-terminal domain-containing protein [Clostridioides difficile]MBY2078220.1 Rho termination factor N-terminal domain-conta